MKAPQVGLNETCASALMWLGALACTWLLWAATVLVVMWFCVSVFGTVGWLSDPARRSLSSINLSHQLTPLASVTRVYPALYCSQHTSRENINISKPSTDNSPPLYFSLFLILPSFPRFAFAFFLICNLSLVSLRLSSLLSLSLQQGKHHCHGERDDNNEAAANHTDC